MASCKACGEYQLMEKGSSSSSLHSAALELASFINSDMPWTKVAKGHRSSLRRPRSSVDITLKACGKLDNTESERLEMPVSESEKLGVSVLGCHFNEKVEHVPIKKRRFLFRAPSPPHKSPSIFSEGSERHAEGPNASGQNANNSCLPSISVLGGDICQIRSIYNNIDGKSFAGVYERTCEAEDFSGISILAAAACCISLAVDEDCGMAPGTVLFEKGSLEAPIADESKEDLVDCANLSTDECGSCLSMAPSNTTTSSTMYAPSPDTPIFDGSSSQLHEVVAPVILQSKTNLAECKKQECFARDDRLHWDLNTVMDAWEQPFEHQDTNSSAADRNVKQATEENVFKGANWDSCELGRERGGTYSDIKKTVQAVCLKDMPNEIEVSMTEEYKFDHCAGIRGAVMYEEKLQSPKTASALNVVVKGAEFSHDEHRDSVDGGSLCGVPSKLIPIHPASAAIANSGNLNCRSNDDYSCGEVVGMDFLDDCSPPPGFDNFIKVNAPKRIFSSSSADVGCRNDINEPTNHMQTSMTIFSEKQNLSPRYLPFPENGARGSVNFFTEGDDEVRRNSPLMTMKNSLSEGTALLQESNPFCLVEDNSIVESSSNIRKLDILESPAAPHVHLPLAIGSGKHDSISAMCDVAETDSLMGIGAENVLLTEEEKKSTTMLLGPPPVLSHDGDKTYSCDHESSIKGTKLQLDNSSCYNNFLSEHELGNKTQKLDENSAEYDSQYEDGELRESNMRTWQGHDDEDGIVEYGPDNKGAGSNLGVMDAEIRGYQYCPQESSETRVSNPDCGRGSDLISNAPCFYVLLPEKVHSGDRGSDLGPSEVISGSGNKVQNDSKDSSLSAEWKLNLSSWNMHTESRRSSSGVVTKFRGCSTRKVSSRDDENGMEPGDMDKRGNGSSFYRRESLSHFRGLSSHDSFRSRDRVRMQECSSRDADYSMSKSERWCRYSPNVRTSGQSSYTWNHCSESNRGLKRLHSPPFQHPPFNRSGTANVVSVDKSTKEGVVETSDAGRQTTSSSSHTHRSFRSRSPTDRQDIHVGYQPNGDMSHNRFMSMGRGRSVRYVSRFDGGGPKRYHGPPSDDCRESSLEISHRFSRRSRCFSPIERRVNPYGRHRSISRSPSRSRTRSPIRDCGFRRRSSRSPNFRSEVRMRRPRSPSFRHGIEADHVTVYTSGPRNHTSPPPNSRWLNYKQRSSVFDRRSPGRSNPQGGIFGYNDSPRKVKHNDYYRYGHPGRFSDINEVGRDGPRFVGNDDDRMDRGYRRGSIRHRDMDDTLKGFCYNYEDISLGYSRNKDASEYHGRRNPKFNNGIDTRISDFPRSRPREEREPLVDDRDAKNNSETKIIEVRQDGEDVASVIAIPS